jgi:hypothetical protein
MARNDELFTPDSIDDDIDSLMAENHSLFPDLNAQFLRELRSISKEDAASLERVWERLEHYSKQQDTLQEPSLQTPQGQEDDFHILPLQSWRKNKRRISTRSLFTVLAAALTGLFLVSSLGWILAMRYPTTPAAAPNERVGDDVQVSLVPYFNNRGIGSVPGQASFDGSDFSYPAGQLPPEGQQTILSQIPYQFPVRAPGGSDNIAALGQTIMLPQGNYQQAFLLAAASWGTISDKIVVHYTDGSTSSTSQSVYDWSNGPPGIVNTSNRYSPTGIDGPSVHIYAIQIAMDKTKIASSLTLPKTALPSQYTPSLHVFALTLQLSVNASTK